MNLIRFLQLFFNYRNEKQKRLRLLDQLKKANSELIATNREYQQGILNENMEIMAQEEIITSQREKIEYLTKKANVIHNRINNSIDSSLAYFTKHYIVDHRIKAQCYYWATETTTSIFLAIGENTGDASGSKQFPLLGKSLLQQASKQQHLTAASIFEQYHDLYTTHQKGRQDNKTSLSKLCVVEYKKEEGQLFHIGNGHQLAYVRGNKVFFIDGNSPYRGIDSPLQPEDSFYLASSKLCQHPQYTEELFQQSFSKQKERWETDFAENNDLYHYLVIGLGIG